MLLTAADAADRLARLGLASSAVVAGHLKFKLLSLLKVILLIQCLPDIQKPVNLSDIMTTSGHCQKIVTGR